MAQSWALTGTVVNENTVLQFSTRDSPVWSKCGDVTNLFERLGWSRGRGTKGALQTDPGTCPPPPDGILPLLPPSQRSYRRVRRRRRCRAAAGSAPDSKRGRPTAPRWPRPPRRPSGSPPSESPPSFSQVAPAAPVRASGRAPVSASGLAPPPAPSRRRDAPLCSGSLRLGGLSTSQELQLRRGFCNINNKSQLKAALRLPPAPSQNDGFSFLARNTPLGFFPRSMQ